MSEGIRKRFFEKGYAGDMRGIWQIYGEDSNCDFGGHHHSPLLDTVEGRYDEAVDYALTLSHFITWGHGGDIVLRKPKKLDGLSLSRKALLKEQSKLEKRLKEIKNELA